MPPARDVDAEDLEQLNPPDRATTRPDAGLVPATMAELRVRRKPSGELEPVGPVPSLKEGTVFTFYPLTLADQIRYGLDVGGEVDVAHMSLKQMHEILVRHMAAPSFAGCKLCAGGDPECTLCQGADQAVTVGDLQRDYAWLTIYDLVHSILVYSRDRFRIPIVRQAGKDAAGKGQGAVEDQAAPTPG